MKYLFVSKSSDETYCIFLHIVIVRRVLLFVAISYGGCVVPLLVCYVMTSSRYTVFFLHLDMQSMNTNLEYMILLTFSTINLLNM